MSNGRIGGRRLDGGFESVTVEDRELTGGTVALIVAAGRGTRASQQASEKSAAAAPKQYCVIGGRAMLAWTLDAFLGHPAVDGVLAVIHRDDGQLYQTAIGTIQDASGKLSSPVFGGETRQDSVRLGLEALQSTGCERVLIHDAARPFVSPGVISRVIDALDDVDGAIAAVPLADTLKRQQVSQSGCTGGAMIAATVSRAQLWRAQTPQAFRFPVIHERHQAALRASQTDFTDDAALLETAGDTVKLVTGEEGNVKITTAEDLRSAELRLREQADSMANFETRTGTGFDVHRFGEGTSVWLCGVEVPHNRKLEGHSDADVGLHALTDAILGALGDGDIGQHFPPSDPQWKGARSDQFLSDAARRVGERGGRIVNVDVTLLCEAPKIGPHRETMRRAIAEILALDVGRVGVKATTTERLGFTGREEGIAAMASASIMLPSD